MRLLLCAVILNTVIFGNIFVAEARQSCTEGHFFDHAYNACVKDVRRSAASQDHAVSGRPQWGPVNRANCDLASDEMDQSMALCRSYDLKHGGKTIEECARCCRQLREGARRWNLCNKARMAPPVDWSTINASKRRLGCDW